MYRIPWAPEISSDDCSCLTPLWVSPKQIYVPYCDRTAQYSSVRGYRSHAEPKAVTHRRECVGGFHLKGEKESHFLSPTLGKEVQGASTNDATNDAMRLMAAAAHG